MKVYVNSVVPKISARLFVFCLPSAPTFLLMRFFLLRTLGSFNSLGVTVGYVSFVTLYNDIKVKVDTIQMLR